MFINTSHTWRRLSWKWIGLIVAAAIASSALAASALASPTDSVKIDTSGHTAQFGATGSCSAGAAPSGNATADWQEDAGKTTVALSLSGDLCVQKTKDTYRVELRSYYLDPSLGHIEIAASDSRPLTGNNGALNTSAVNLQLPRVFSAAVHHAHIQIQKQDSSGAWVDVIGGLAFVDY
jgi:hypothetical protein